MSTSKFVLFLKRAFAFLTGRLRGLVCHVESSSPASLEIYEKVQDSRVFSCFRERVQTLSRFPISRKPCKHSVWQSVYIHQRASRGLLYVSFGGLGLGVGQPSSWLYRVGAVYLAVHDARGG
eukprot:scaffold66515_cov66-Phaeocystis_antarctica.AAC.3